MKDNSDAIYEKYKDYDFADARPVSDIPALYQALSIKALAELPDESIDTSDIPELDETFWTSAKVVHPTPKPQ